MNQYSSGPPGQVQHGGFYSGAPQASNSTLPGPPPMLRPPGMPPPPTPTPPQLAPPPFVPSSYPQQTPAVHSAQVTRPPPAALPNPPPRPSAPVTLSAPPGGPTHPPIAPLNSSPGAPLTRPAPTLSRPPSASGSASTSTAPGNRPPEEKLVATIAQIPPSADNVFMDALLSIFGAIKTWRRPQADGVLKTFGIIEYKNPESMNIALKVIPGQVVDGKELSMTATKATSLFLAWWREHGAPPAREPEDGEAANDEETKEMEAMEAVMDLLTRRGEGEGGGAGGGPDFGAAGSGRADTRGVRGKRDEADMLVDSVQKSMRSSTGRSAGRSREERLEAEFEADRTRKEAVTEKEGRRARKDFAEALRRVERLESDAKRDRRERSERLRHSAEKRQRLIQQDNEVSDEGEGEPSEWRRHDRSRPARLAEKEADEKDRMKELEEAAEVRAAVPTAATGAPLNKGIVGMEDSIMKAMMNEVKGEAVGGAREPEPAPVQAPAAGAPQGVGGWSIGGALGESVKVKAEATKKAFFGDDDGKEDRKVGMQWLLQQRHDGGATNGGAGGNNGGTGAESFEAEREQFVQTVPGDLRSCASWPLDLTALHLDVPKKYTRVYDKVHAYVNEYMQDDTEMIATVVLSRVSHGESVDKIVEFCEFMGKDAATFVLKLFRLLIAESEIAKLAAKWGRG